MQAPGVLIVHGGMSTQHPCTNVEAWRYAYQYFKRHPPPARFTLLGYNKPKMNFRPRQWWVRLSNKTTEVRAQLCDVSKV